MGSKFDQGKMTNIAPENGQPTSKLVLTLATAGSDLAPYDSLRSVSGGDGGEATLNQLLQAGERITTFETNGVNNLGNLAWGTSIWLYDINSFNYQEFKIASAAVNTVTLAHSTEVAYRFDGTVAGDVLVSVTPPFDDVFMLDIQGPVATSNRVNVVFSNVDPTGITEATLATLPPLFVESFTVTPLVGDVGSVGVTVPLDACPARFISLVNAAASNFDGSGGGGTDGIVLTLHRKRNLTTLLGTM